MHYLVVIYSFFISENVIFLKDVPYVLKNGMSPVVLMLYKLQGAMIRDSFYAYSIYSAVRFEV